MSLAVEFTQESMNLSKLPTFAKSSILPYTPIFPYKTKTQITSHLWCFKDFFQSDDVFVTNLLQYVHLPFK